MKHHQFGFSKWPAILSCPRFASDDKESEESKRGTSAHEDLAEWLAAYLRGVPCLNENGDAGWAADTICKIAETTNVFSESFLSVGEDNACVPGVYGTCDAWAKRTRDNTICVFDFKSGAQSGVDYMPQVKGYAYAISLNMRKSGETVSDNVECYVLYGASHTVVKRTYTFGDLADTAFNVHDVITSSGTMEPKCCANCKYCANAMKCKASVRAVVDIADDAISGMSDAKRYDFLVGVKGMIEKALEDLKTIAAESKDKALDDGEIRYELHTDKRGRSTGVDVCKMVKSLEDELSTYVAPYLLLAKCSMSKKDWCEMMIGEAKSHGKNKKYLEELYDNNCKFGNPASRMVKVERN